MKARISCPRDLLFFVIATVLFLSVAWSPQLATAASDQKNGRVITLDAAIRIALENNASIKAASEANRGALYRVRRSKLNLLPRMDLQLNYARLDPGSVRRGNVFVEPGRALVENFGSGDPNDVRPGAYSNNFSTAFQLVQPIYNGGANWAAISLARAQEAATENNLEDVRQQVILDVRIRYLRVLQAKELVGLAQKNLASAVGHLTSVRNMLDVGLRNRAEVLRWEVEKAVHQGEVVEAENNLKIALAALKQVMGVSFQEAFAVSPLPFDPEPLEAGTEEQVNRTLVHHPRLKSFDATVDTRRAGVRLAWSAFQPKLNFVYQLGWEENNTFALDNFSHWRAGLSLSLPIFHSFQNLASLQEAKAQLRGSEADKKEAESLLALAVIRARSNLESSVVRFEIAKKALEQATENLRILNNSYEVGLATNIDVLDAEVVKTKTESALIHARYDYWIARAELDRALGVLKP